MKYLDNILNRADHLADLCPPEIQDRAQEEVRRLSCLRDEFEDRLDALNRMLRSSGLPPVKKGFRP